MSEKKRKKKTMMERNDNDDISEGDHIDDLHRGITLSCIHTYIQPESE